MTPNLGFFLASIKAPFIFALDIINKGLEIPKILSKKDFELWSYN